MPLCSAGQYPHHQATLSKSIECVEDVLLQEAWLDKVWRQGGREGNSEMGVVLQIISIGSWT